MAMCTNGRSWFSPLGSEIESESRLALEYEISRWEVQIGVGMRGASGNSMITRRARTGEGLESRRGVSGRESERGRGFLHFDQINLKQRRIFQFRPLFPSSRCVVAVSSGLQSSHTPHCQGRTGDSNRRERYDRNGQFE